MTPRDWDRVYREHAPRLRRIIARRVPSAAVDDVLQETFLRAYRSRHTLDGSRPAGPWLTTIAVRTASDLRPKRVEATFSEEAAPAAPDAHEELRRSTRLRAVESAFASLRPRQRRLLAAVAIEGTSQAELARREGIAPEAVRAAVSRARHRFQACLERLSRESGLAGVTSIRPTVARLRSRFEQLEPLLPANGQAWLGLAALAVFAAAGPASTGTREQATAAPAAVVSGADDAMRSASPPSSPALAKGPTPRSSPSISAGLRVDERRVAGAGGGAAVGVGPRQRTVEADALGTKATIEDNGNERTIRLTTQGPGFDRNQGNSFNCAYRFLTLVCPVYDVVVAAAVEPAVEHAEASP
ncbi:MAG TPA: sigma-70 family RNA polymerase sigma factor [Acidimicrobiales bacterium]|nr:sigma-70 family RNA polymerase sigma factor [Acidimicrobiales bacterium]